MPSASAVVARTHARGIEYLLTIQGAAEWGPRSQMATRFATVREATRAAMRLPGRLRAYALPLGLDGGELFGDAA